MKDKQKQQGNDDWANTISIAASEGQMVIVPDQPIEEVLRSGYIAYTPAVRKQMAHQIALSAIGHLQQGAVEEAAERCRQALTCDHSCEPAQACELAVLRRKCKRSFTDDRHDMENGTRDPFVIGLSYSTEMLAVQSQKDDILAFQ